MSSVTAAMASAMLSGSSMYLLAWRIHGHRYDPSIDEVAVHLGKIVSQEEIIAQEHRLRTIAQRANRTAMPNAESGPPARVSRGIVGRETFFQQKVTKLPIRPGKE